MTAPKRPSATIRVRARRVTCTCGWRADVSDPARAVRAADEHLGVHPFGRIEAGAA